MRIIYLIDGGFFCSKYREAFNKYPTAKKVLDFVKKFNKKYNDNYIYFRIYFYDCPPLDKKLKNPISNSEYNLRSSQRYNDSISLLKKLKKSNFVSVREGILSHSGWTLKQTAFNKIKNNIALTDHDFKPNICQKGVDIKIGLDMAWISLNKIADRIILITGDSDFIPAMKFVRRSGIQVFLSTLNHGVFNSLKEHSDVLIEHSINTIMS